MLNDVEDYLALRRAAGFEMKNAECLLKNFALFAAERKETHVNMQTAIDWAALGPSVAQRDERLKAVCRFARYILIEDDRHEAPPANHFGARKKRRPPHIYSTDEINRLIENALQLRPKNGLRSQTYAALIALLAATGLRISEALKLKVADITKDGLLIRETKFRKTRLAPLHDTTAAGLERYLRRRQPGSSEDLVFICDHGRPLRYMAVRDTFNRLVRKVGIRPAPSGRRRRSLRRDPHPRRDDAPGDRPAKPRFHIAPLLRHPPRHPHRPGNWERRHHPGRPHGRRNGRGSRDRR